MPAVTSRDTTSPIAVFDSGVGGLAVLHECLYGSPPVDGAVVVEGREVPPELTAVIAQGLAADPRQRYQSARAFAEGLTRVLRA